MHPEDIKATIRKRFGTILQFEDAHDLPRKSVNDFLRGRSNQRVKDAVAKLLPPGQSELSDGSEDFPDAHRLNAVAK